MIRLNKVIDEVEFIIKNPNRKTYPLNIQGLDDLYKVVLGSTTYIGGIPSHGKSEWHMEMLIRLTELHGFRHILFSPESGSPAEIYLELVCKFLRKTNKVGAFNKITIDEFRKQIAYVGDYFIIRDQTETPPTIDELLTEVKEMQRESDIHTISIDPFNELTHDFGVRQDVYLSEKLGKIRSFSRMNNLHTFIIAHPRTLQKNKEGSYEPPTAYELSGGGTWYAKADSILCVYRPNEFDYNGSYEDRCKAEILVQKAKPKHVGVKGIFETTFEPHTNRYKYLEPENEQFFKANF